MAATATAGMLALSPLAFANDHGARERGGGGPTSFGFWFDRDDIQQDGIIRCTNEQTINGLPPTTPAPIPPLVSQEQSGNCVNVPDGAERTRPTPPPTTTVPPAPTDTYTRSNIITAAPGTPANEDSAYCDPGDTRLDISYTDPSGVAFGPAYPAQFQDRQGATIAYSNPTSEPVQLSVTVLCEDTNSDL
ncbi:hypothetical protein [Pseudonocardia xinjiangensis]|uniref:Uncharacterized protein n=1 Tax=Pseudonocardia xinjiangensis TaxID=75289 RepID=A0ABX1RFT1_9PSEU|nr:hypothetical protein [Pseudonocardia xinjiangensis]NMH78011.1 hypothetical protein [Pseudonocardia xinjiangensis]